MLLVSVTRGVYHAIGTREDYRAIIADSPPGDYTVLIRDCGCPEGRHDDIFANRLHAVLAARWHHDHPYDGLSWVQIDHAEIVGTGDDEFVRYRNEIVERGTGTRCRILFDKLKRRGITPGSILRLYSRCGVELAYWFCDFEEPITTEVNNGNLEASER